MTIYRCRFTKPTTEAWFNVESTSPGDAALTHHDNNYNVGYLYHINKANGGIEAVRFALIEVDGYRNVLTRMFSSGIWRKGGLQPKEHKELPAIAAKLGWEANPNDLIQEGWEMEEAYK